MIDEDALASIERLHKMKADGIITEADFETAKADILSGRRTATIRQVATDSTVLPAEDDYVGWMLLPLKRYADFNGRSTRREFWMFQIPYVGLLLVSLISYGVFGMLAILLAAIIAVGGFVPQLAVQVRRFHDQNRSGLLVLANLIPYVGALGVLIFMLMPGTEGDNDFGPDPLA